MTEVMFPDATGCLHCVHFHNDNKDSVSCPTEGMYLKLTNNGRIAGCEDFEPMPRNGIRRVLWLDGRRKG